MKRTVVVALWVFSFWYLGNAVAAVLGVSDMFGPILGVAAGGFVALDPAKAISGRGLKLGS